MANYGEFLSSGWYSSSKGDYVYLEFAWVVTETSEENNTKKIYWEFRGKRAASGYVMSGPFKVNIDNETVFSSSTRIELRNGTVIANGYKTLTHNTDGTRSFDVYIEGGIYTSAINCTGSKTFTLDTIPRKATLTAAPDFTDLDNPTITYSNPAGNSVTSLMACISFTGAADDIAYRHVSKTDGAYTFELTDEERDVLREGTQGSSRSVIFHLRTYIGNSTYYSVLRKTLTIADSEATKPTVSMTLSPVSTLNAPFNEMYIQGKSKVKAELTIGTKYGANIEASVITVEDLNYNSPYESAVLTKPGLQSVKATVRDNRKLYGTAYENINVLEYSKPLVIPGDGENAILCYRSDGNGKRMGNSTSVWVKAKRFYHSVEGKNTCSLLYRVKRSNDSWGEYEIYDWEGLIYGDDSRVDEYNGLIDWVFDPKTSYTVQIMAIDDIGEFDIKTFEIPTQDVALHLGKGGKNVSIGTYCDYSEDRTFYSEWKAIFGGGVCIGDSNTTLKDYILQVINGGG